MTHYPSSTDSIGKILKMHGIKRTHARVESLKALFSAHSAISLSEIMSGLKDVDRITIYRTMHTFVEKGIVHTLVDTNGVTRYAVCGDKCNENLHFDNHAHFYCRICKKTICIDFELPNLSKLGSGSNENIRHHDQRILEIEISKGFQIESIQTLATGICPDCNNSLKSTA